MFSTTARAATCRDQRKKTIDAITFQVIATQDGRCWYLTGPSAKLSMFYRDFLFDDAGFILVFNSYGLGEESKTSGGREYYVFPRSHEVGMQASTAGVRVTFANGASALYSAQTAQWEDVQGISLHTVPDVVIGDEGGWELRPQSGVVLDFGFRMGGSPSGSATRSARFIDAKGETCTVRNSEILEWTEDGDPSLKFADDAAVETYLKVRCPDISWR
ncbi:MAG: hypothetical protein NDI61_12150 [Bdellovibrionaceae bacterium]|nr:hypothetical protein [Pseudobdellovibrionaceae bacterium]